MDSVALLSQSSESLGTRVVDNTAYVALFYDYIWVDCYSLPLLFLYIAPAFLCENAAYGVTTETQKNKEASSVATSENDAYGVTTNTHEPVTSENAAYGVTTKTQGNREARSLVTSENAAYGVTTETQEPVMSENAAYGAAPLSGRQ